MRKNKTNTAKPDFKIPVLAAFICLAAMFAGTAAWFAFTGNDVSGSGTESMLAVQISEDGKLRIDAGKKDLSLDFPHRYYDFELKPGREKLLDIKNVGNTGLKLMFVFSDSSGNVSYESQDESNRIELASEQTEEFALNAENGGICRLVICEKDVFVKPDELMGFIDSLSSDSQPGEIGSSSPRISSEDISSDNTGSDEISSGDISSAESSLYEISSD